jgi:murein DD-endopeptidase MepM/ murein hydrolase activator NlpD
MLCAARIVPSGQPEMRSRFPWLCPVHSFLRGIALFLVLALAGCRTVAISTPTSQSTPLTLPAQTLVPTVTSRVPPVGETQTPTALPSPTPNPIDLPDLCSPLAEHQLVELSAIVSSPYDPPPMGKDDRHQGVDFAYYNQGGRASILGEGVQAILAGRVVLAMADRLPYGNMVLLETPQSDLPPGLAEQLGIGSGESLYHLYAHFQNEPQVQTGDWVVCGQFLGQVGMSGYNIPVAHLHLETRIGPAAAEIGPMVFYDTQASQAEMDTYRLWRMSGTFRHFNPMIIFERVAFLEEQQP